jgi:HEAT repeat protein
LQTTGYQPLRFSAAVTLGNIGSPARAAIPALAQALGDQDFNIRMEAALALAKIGPDYSQAAPQLERLLRDSSSGVRLRAALALWRLHPADTAASNRVAHFLLEDPDLGLRSWAAFLIGDLGPAAAAFSPALRDALRDPDSHVQQNANYSLKKLNPPIPVEIENRKN